MPTASVIVPARNAQRTLGRTLEALAAQQLDGAFEVLVVDDGSTDGTASVARAAPGPVRVLAQPRCGPAAARNLGVERSSAPLLAFCDADVFPTPGWLQAGVDALGAADLVQGRVVPDPLARPGPFDRSLWINGLAGLWEAANLFVVRELFTRVGGFTDWIRPRVGKPIAEDVWFGYRALELGAMPAFSELALAHHAVFERDWRGYVAERRRLAYFPAIARRMPELRREFLYRRAFLDRRSAMLDLALLGGLTALLTRSPLPLVAVVPYLGPLRAHSQRARPAGPRAGAVAAADLLADLVGLGAMASGSVRARSLVI
ncbi:MAG: glycosyltransferase family 2 protein [Solirubrobacterales bacterium]|nr:glycosyltransferase family 2 protein [Solirubrobacterales bacterium]